MDPSLRSSLFNRMMQAMELGDKCTTDKIESLIRNFHPDSPVPISVYVPSSEDDFIPNISPPSSNSDSPVMPRSSKPGGSKRCASRAPRENPYWMRRRLLTLTLKIIKGIGCIFR